MRAPILVLILVLQAAIAPGFAADAPSATVPAPPMSATEFEAYTLGKTLTFSQFGATYGAEEYLPNRKVRWAFQGEQCAYGEWYPQDDEICFVYEHDPTPQCWHFWRSEGRLKGLFVDYLPDEELTEVSQSTEPLLCAGPDLGV